MCCVRLCHKQEVWVLDKQQSWKPLKVRKPRGSACRQRAPPQKTGFPFARAIFSRPGPQTIRHTNFLEEKGVLSDALRRSFSKILRERLAEHVKKGVWDGTSTNQFLRVAVSCTIPDPTTRHLKRWCEFGMCCPAVRWIMPNDVWFVFDQICFRGTTVFEKCVHMFHFSDGMSMMLTSGVIMQIWSVHLLRAFVIPSSRCVFRATNGTCSWESFPDQRWRWRAQFCNGSVWYVSTLELRH